MAAGRAKPNAAGGFKAAANAVLAVNRMAAGGGSGLLPGPTPLVASDKSRLLEARLGAGSHSIYYNPTRWP